MTRDNDGWTQWINVFSINSMAQDTNGWTQWLNVFSINSMAQDTNGWTHNLNFAIKTKESKHVQGTKWTSNSFWFSFLYFSAGERLLYFCFWALVVFFGGNVMQKTLILLCPRLKSPQQSWTVKNDRSKTESAAAAL